MVSGDGSQLCETSSVKVQRTQRVHMGGFTGFEIIEGSEVHCICRASLADLADAKVWSHHAQQHRNAFIGRSLI